MNRTVKIVTRDDAGYRDITTNITSETYEILYRTDLADAVMTGLTPDTIITTPDKKMTGEIAGYSYDITRNCLELIIVMSDNTIQRLPVGKTIQAVQSGLIVINNKEA